MRKSSNSPLAAISLPSISHRRSGTAHRKSVQHERHEFPWPDPIDQNADAHRHENDQRNIVHMQLQAKDMNWQDVNQIKSEPDRQCDVTGVNMTVRLDIGGWRIMTKENTKKEL